MEEFIYGSEGKLLLDIKPIGGHSAYNLDFNVELYTNPKKKVVIDKYNCIPTEENPDLFYVVFDTKELGVGDLTVEIEAFVPDDCFADGKRTERVRIESVATIIP